MAEQRRGREPKGETPETLHQAALRYLARFDTSAGRLRAVLVRRLDRAALHDEAAPERLRPEIETVIARLQAAGLLDDEGYAARRTRSLLGRGDSPAAVRQRLRRDGIDESRVRSALAEFAAESGGPPALTAAVNLARRRRLGPYRPAESRAKQRLRDLARLARAGFDPDIARKVIDCANVAELEAELENGFS